MKINGKVLRMVIGIIFIVNAVNGVLSLINIVATSVEIGYFIQGPVSLVMNLYGIIISVIYGITILKQKKINMLTSSFGAIYIIYIVFNMIGNITHGISLSSVVLIVAFVLAYMGNDEMIAFIRKITNNLEREQVASKQQDSFYDEQLKDGIITQEEYNQIMSVQNSLKDDLD